MLIKVYTLLGRIVSIVDLDNPLPSLWELKLDKFSMWKEKFENALRMMCELKKVKVKRIDEPHSPKANVHAA